MDSSDHPLLGVFVFSRLFFCLVILFYFYFLDSCSRVSPCVRLCVFYFPQGGMIPCVLWVPAFSDQVSCLGALQAPFSFSSPSEFLCGSIEVRLSSCCIEFHCVSSLLSRKGWSVGIILVSWGRRCFVFCPPPTL